MQRLVNQEEARVTWGLDKWYEKTVYVIGIVGLVIMAFSFAVGFATGLAQSASNSDQVQTTSN